MKCLQVIILLLVMVISSLASNLPLESTGAKSVHMDDESSTDEESVDVSSFYGENGDFPNNNDDAGPGSLRGAGRFLAQKTRVATTCNNYPRVCRARGSPGPDCCKKTCVDVDVDGSNCGSCGNKCKYLEICCKGKCVNPLVDKKNCGGCSKKCKKGDQCSYGMCTYA